MKKGKAGDGFAWPPGLPAGPSRKTVVFRQVSEQGWVNEIVTLLLLPPIDPKLFSRLKRLSHRFLKLFAFSGEFGQVVALGFRLPINMGRSGRFDRGRSRGFTPFGPIYFTDFINPGLHGDVGNVVAVGTALAGGPPHRSVRAELPHTALTSGVWHRSVGWDRDAGPWERVTIGRRSVRTEPSSSGGVGSGDVIRATRSGLPGTGTRQGSWCCLEPRGS